MDNNCANTVLFAFVILLCKIKLHPQAFDEQGVAGFDVLDGNLVATAKIILRLVFRERNNLWRDIYAALWVGGKAVRNS